VPQPQESQPDASQEAS
jgi:hypothetical protein